MHTPQHSARQAGRTFQTCSDCSLTWDRTYSPKDIVLCPLHAAAPKLLAALESIAEHGDEGSRTVAREALREAKGE